MDMQYEHEATTLFEVREEIDQSEGRGGTRVVGYALSREIADANATGKGVMGGPGHVQEIEVFRATLYVSGMDNELYFYYPKSAVINPDDLLDDTPAEAEAAKQRALEKLTPHERKLLGLPLT